MKKNFLDSRKQPQVKVGKLTTKPVENGVVVFIALCLLANLIISLSILFS